MNVIIFSSPLRTRGWPWVRERRKISPVPLAPVLAKKGINFIQDRVTKIDAENNKLELKDGDALDYDYLVITTGPRLAFEEVPGSGPEGFTTSICTTEHAANALDDYNKLVENPGPVIVGAMPFASCFGPAYEFAFILDWVLRKKKMRNKVPMTFVTSEPYIGHLGLGGVGDSRGMLESDLRAHNINFITNAKTTKVEDGMMFVDEMNEDGSVKKQHELPFTYSMMLPAFKGADAVAEVEG